MGTGLLKRRKANKQGSIYQNKYQKQPWSLSPPPLSPSSATPDLRMLHLFTKTGVSPVLPKSTNAWSHHSSAAASAADPLWLNEKWYSPARESACCYGNTSHLACSHPTLLPVSWQWWQKNSYKNNTEDKWEHSGKEEKRCSHRHTCVHWWYVVQTKHMFRDCWVMA